MTLFFPLMQLYVCAKSADFVEESADFSVPEFQVWLGAWTGCFGEEEVSDGEVADGTGLAIGFGIEFTG